MSSSRRDFLKASGLVVMAGAGGFLGMDQFVYGQDDTEPVKADAARQRPTLVTIFLRGGADALHVFVPYGDPLYYQYRKRLVLRAVAAGKGEGKGQQGCIPIGDSKYFGINHRMADLVPLIKDGALAPIINVGSTNPTRSHFSAQDYMERAAPGENAITTGWLNRYLEATRKPYDAPLRGLSARTLVPRALRGNYPVLAGNNHTEQMDLFADLYSGKNLVNMNARDGSKDERGSSLDELNTKQKGLLTADATRDIIATSGANAVERIKALDRVDSTWNDANYPNGELGDQLRTIARVIKANVGLEVAQADYNGWDHHSDEGGANGRMSGMLSNLTECLTAFRKDLGKRMDKVLVLVMTEFGRTVHENGANGTDHGRGSFMLAMGDMLKSGGKLLGTWNGLTDLDSGRFQPVHTDFRAVFAESLTRLFHVDPFKVRIFPEYSAGPRAFLDFMNVLPEA